MIALPDSARAVLESDALAHTYMGPDVKFPHLDNPPPGYITHITVDRVGGVGPWAREV